MKPKNARRYLIAICILSFVVWIVTTFGGMVLWYAKGAPAIAGSQAEETWNSFTFNIIPGITFGYFLLGLLIVNLLTKTKATDDNGPNA